MKFIIRFVACGKSVYSSAKQKVLGLAGLTDLMHEQE